MSFLAGPSTYSASKLKLKIGRPFPARLAEKEAFGMQTESETLNHEPLVSDGVMSLGFDGHLS